MSNLRNLEAERALYAFNSASYGESKGKEFNYSAAVLELPSIIRMNGLRAAMAYFYSKKENSSHRLIFEQVRDWFERENEPTRFMNSKFNLPSRDESKIFMKILLDLTDDEYRIVQAETQTLANWMIRFLKTEDPNNPSNIQDHDAGQPQT
jgi:CRISPR type III-B/RAMP module-associated protein Cmr5